jgi:hypothetical protein
VLKVSSRVMSWPVKIQSQTLFRDPKLGGMQLMLQYSYLQRTPLAVPAGSPSSATMKMFYVNVRYLLP